MGRVTHTCASSVSTVVRHVVLRGKRLGGECFGRSCGRMTAKINISQWAP